MKVNVTLEFSTVEEAIKFLGDKVMAPLPQPKPKPEERVKVGGRGPGRPKKAAEPVKSSPVEAPQAVPAPAPAAPEAAAPDAAATLAAPPSATEAPVAAAPVPPDAEVQAALQAVLNTKGMPAVTELLGKYGARRGREVPPEKRAELVELCRKAVA